MFNIWKLTRKGAKNQDNVPIWDISLELIDRVESDSLEEALVLARALHPRVLRSDLLVGPGGQRPPVHPRPARERVYPRTTQ